MPTELVSSEYQDVSITISPSTSVVVERRIVSLPENLTRITLQNFPQQISPSSLHFQSKTDPLTFVEYQVKQEPLIKNSLSFDLKSASKRLQGQRVTVKRDSEHIVGYFVAIDGDTLIIREPSDDGETKLSFHSLTKGVEVIIADKTQIPNYEEDEKNYEYQFLSDVRTTQPGDHSVDIQYTTAGIHAEVFYTLQVNEKEGTFKFVGNVTVSNHSGKSYDNATIFLSYESADLKTPYNSKEAKSNFFSKGGSRAKPLKQHYLSSVFPAEGKKISLANKSEIQYSFFSRTFPIKYYYLLKTLDPIPIDSISIEDNYPTINIQLIKVYSIENNIDNNLGIYFPKGKCDVFIYNRQNSSDNSGIESEKSNPMDESESIKEELELNEVKKSPSNSPSTLHTWHSTFIYPINPGEPIEIPISSSSAIKASKSKKSFKKDEKKGTIVESFQLTITNYQEKAPIIVEDTLFRSANWELSRVTPANYYSVGQYHARWEFPECNMGEVLDIRYTVTYNYIGVQEPPAANSAVNVNNNQIEVNEEQAKMEEDKPDLSGSFFSKIFSKKKKEK